MERRIEDGDLGDPGAERLANGEDPLQVVRVVERRELDVVLDPADHLVVDQDRVPEALAAVDDPVAHSFDLAHAAGQHAGFRAREPLEDAGDGGAVIAHGDRLPHRPASRRVETNQGVPADPFDDTLGQALVSVARHAVRVRPEEDELQRR